jgi:hypothetical protein
MRKERRMEVRMGQTKRPGGCSGAAGRVGVGGCVVDRVTGRVTGRVMPPILMAALLGGWLAVSAAPAQTSKPPAPARVHTSVIKRVMPTVHAGIVKLRVGKKVSSYHRTTQAHPAEFALQGPVRLQVLARNIFAAAGAAPIRLRLELDGKPVKTLRLKAAASTKAKLVDGGPVGALYRATIEVPVGAHKVRVVPEDASGMAAIRLFKGNAARGGKVKWVAFAPQAYERPLILHTGDKEETWYRFTPQKPAEMTIRGPLRLKISTRLDFDQHAGTSQGYVVRAFIDAKSEGYSLKSRASQVGTYPEMGEIVPGLAQTFIIKVPTGTHQVSLRLDGTTAAGATVRILVPERELKAGNRS